MIREVRDPAIVNELLNDPLIRPTVGGVGVLDATDLLANRHNICLLADGGGALFRWTGPGVYEGHSFFRVRGREAIALGKTIIGQLRQRATVDLLWGLTPEGLKHVRWFNRKLGFLSLGMMDVPEGRYELFEMRF